MTPQIDGYGRRTSISPYPYIPCLSIRLGSHIHDFELRWTATFEIGASGSELQPAPNHQEANCGV